MNTHKFRQIVSFILVLALMIPLVGCEIDSDVDNPVQETPAEELKFTDTVFFANGETDTMAIYIWEHELFEIREVSKNIYDLITKYYNNEI